jgi:hypothetical protein
MERNSETLSTRDLASPNEPAGGVTTSEGEMQHAAAPEGQPGVYDQTARAEEGTPLPVDEGTQVPADERTAADEQPRPPAREQTAPAAEARTGASVRDETVEASGPDAGLGAEGDAPGHQAENRPAKSTQAASTQDQDAEAAPPSTGAAELDSDAGGSLLPADMDATFQQRWKEIQTRFVDEPRRAVEDADSLVANLMQQLAAGFAKERERLEAQWGRGEDISTEDLRVALQRYRTFFQRLLST